MQHLPTGKGDDPRFTAALITDVMTVLREHAYREPEHDPDRSIALGRMVEALLHLARAFEGLDS